jgi:hypothetical protein
MLRPFQNGTVQKISTQRRTCSYSSSNDSNADDRKESQYKSPGPSDAGGDRGSHYVAYVFAFVGNVRCNKAVTCVDTCSQLPFWVLRCLLCFLSFPLAGPPLQGSPKKLLSPGSEPALGGPAHVECRGILAPLPLVTVRPSESPLQADLREKLVDRIKKRPFVNQIHESRDGATRFSFNKL